VAITRFCDENRQIIIFRGLYGELQSYRREEAFSPNRTSSTAAQEISLLFCGSFLSGSETLIYLELVLRIRDILERLRILGSVAMTNGSGCGSGSHKNIRIRIRNTGTFTSFFKDKKVIKKSQNIRNQGFPYYFCLLMEGPEPKSNLDPYL
jgi:hypothetical protein